MWIGNVLNVVGDALVLMEGRGILAHDPVVLGDAVRS